MDQQPSKAAVHVLASNSPSIHGPLWIKDHRGRAGAVSWHSRGRFVRYVLAHVSHKIWVKVNRKAAGMRTANPFKKNKSQTASSKLTHIFRVDRAWCILSRSQNNLKLHEATCYLHDNKMATVVSFESLPQTLSC